MSERINMENVEEFTYFEANNVLRVLYKGGSSIDYHPVNPETFSQMVGNSALVRAINKTLRSVDVVGVRKASNNQ